MKEADVAAFFDQRAPYWDSEMVRNEAIIETILDCGEIREGICVLDVACGTGVLFPDYIKRKVRSLTAIDISSEMVRIAKEKFPEINVVCGDVQTYLFAQKFDAIMVYNAFPHFPNPEKLLRVLAGQLKPHGRLTIAHGMSREALSRHHSGAAAKISIPLLHENEIEEYLTECGLGVDYKIADHEKFIVSGKMLKK